MTLLLILTTSIAWHTTSCDRLTNQKAATMGVLKGTITDTNGASMQNVSVRIEGSKSKRNVFTDNKGKYEAELPSDDYYIIVTHEGYLSFQSESFNLQPNTTKTFDIHLDLPSTALTSHPLTSSGTDSPDIIEIDFGNCAPERRRRVDVTYGFTIYEIIGNSGDGCMMKYSSENGNPDEDRFIGKICVVPRNLGKQRFKRNEAGVDFSSLEPYCKASGR